MHPSVKAALRQRCPKCEQVYIPPRGSCAACGVPTEEEVELADKATVESFTIVSIPIPGNPIEPPFVVANLVPDGGEQPDVLIGKFAIAPSHSEQNTQHFSLRT